MPDAEPTNPYAPPGAVPLGPSRGTPPGSGAMVRVVAVLAGFSLLADPGVIPLFGPLANAVPHGRLAARVVGLALLIAAFLPWRLQAQPDRPFDEL